MFWVKATGSLIVPAIPEAASQSRGSALPRLQGVEACLLRIVRMQVAVRVEQL
ncbi:hypothetical protein LMG27174_07004 [Paraburkholderia rhynchosiae]|uniref:Uncharacterized protein n=1 Tax=Paraburkholderia rhynchosiae TaxID=487049 RepID=A0A6J5CTT7_9BURK|nr:hypothetical protein LMG27174_07004 [Paraburkholderia rhynchosiae]